MRYLIDQIENVLYYHTFPTPADRIEACICAHAATKDLANTPRIFVPHAPHSSQSYYLSLIDICATTDIKDTEKKTNQFLNNVGIDHTIFKSISKDQKDDILNLVENFIIDKSGKGNIYYSLSRFTPFNNEDAIEMIQPFINAWHQHYELIRKIKERQKDKLLYISKYKDICFNKFAPWEKDCFDRAIIRKINKLWQIKWLDGFRYKNHIPEEKLIQSILFTKEI